jgi:hypothetical protein
MSDDPRARFRDFVELHMEPHKILPEDHERTLVGEGISRFNLDGEHARGVVAVAANRSGQMLASDASRSIRNVLRGTVSKRQFDKAVVILTAMVKGQITEAEARAWVKRVIEHSDLKPRGRGLFRSKRWFRRIKPIK